MGNKLPLTQLRLELHLVTSSFPTSMEFLDSLDAFSFRWAPLCCARLCFHDHRPRALCDSPRHASHMASNGVRVKLFHHHWNCASGSCGKSA